MEEWQGRPEEGQRLTRNGAGSGNTGYKISAESGSISITVCLIANIIEPYSVIAPSHRNFKFKMVCRIPSGCFVLVVAIFLILVLGTEAQLNFSTGWGKRSQIPQAGDGNTMCSTPGKPSLNQLLALYNLIQNEAQKMLDCQKFTK